MKSTVRKQVIFIEGMTCQSCVNIIETTIGQKAGIHWIKVDLTQKFALVMFDSTLLSPSDLANAVDDMGFDASIDANDALTAVWIGVNGMTCQSCVKHIEGTIRPLIGVRSVKVSLDDKIAVVLYDSSLVTDETLRNAFDDVGFEAEIKYKDENR
ncbi:MAG: copper ion binding protein [Algoriphagus sp.]|nr:copper ion binding protein [Algoriphagus sp.]